MSCMTLLFNLALKRSSLLYFIVWSVRPTVQCVIICCGNVRVIHVLNFDVIEPVEMKAA